MDLGHISETKLIGLAVRFYVWGDAMKDEEARKHPHLNN